MSHGVTPGRGGVKVWHHLWTAPNIKKSFLGITFGIFQTIVDLVIITGAVVQDVWTKSIHRDVW